MQLSAEAQGPQIRDVAVGLLVEVVALHAVLKNLSGALHVRKARKKKLHLAALQTKTAYSTQGSESRPHNHRIQLRGDIATCPTCTWSKNNALSWGASCFSTVLGTLTLELWLSGPSYSNFTLSPPSTSQKSTTKSWEPGFMNFTPLLSRAGWQPLLSTIFSPSKYSREPLKADEGASGFQRLSVLM